MCDPDLRYTDLGADYYETRMHARNHVRSLERLGYHVKLHFRTRG